VALLLVGLVLGGAAAPSQSAPSASVRSFRVTVYFLIDGQSAPLGVRRTVMRRGFAPLARLALEQLLAGPSAREPAEGLTSAIPAGAEIRFFSIVQRPKGSTATVDLAGLPSLANVNGTTIARIGTQIACTLIGVSDVTRVASSQGDALGTSGSYMAVSRSTPGITSCSSAFGSATSKHCPKRQFSQLPSRVASANWHENFSASCGDEVPVVVPTNRDSHARR
jgi:Sporulation and spore germination